MNDVNRYNNGYGWTVYCKECNTKFDAKREDATFCSDKCRQRNNRRDKKLERDRQKAKLALFAWLENGNFSDLDIEQMKKMIKQLESYLYD